MSKNIYYRYNPETDNFERVYPSLRMRLASWGKIWAAGGVLAVVLFFVVFYCFDSPTEENLRAENARLRTQYSILNRRLDNSLRVMDRLRERDDNFYRVMMQMDPVSETQRHAGLENEARYRDLQKISDANLVTEAAKRMDFLERQLYVQARSFGQLREAIGQQQDKMEHIPAVFPLQGKEFSLASGFGYRRDPVYGSTSYHEGIDMAASMGTPVFATGDGEIISARREPGYGNCIDIDHGYNYMSRYAHLSEILVKPGDEVKRGQLIGKVGSTGKSMAPHLHYEVRFKGDAQNPVNYCFMDLSPQEYADMVQLSDNAGHVLD